MFGLGMRELLVILLIVLILFGASRVPEIARSLGKALGEFKKGTKDAKEELEAAARIEDEKEEEKEQ
jgi:TatA/E family protein of Tat protein translocase